MKVICLHGYLSNANHERLLLRFKNVEYWNAFGHGGRSGSTRNWTHAFFEEEDKLKKLAARGIEVILIGHSMGATKAISHAMLNENVIACFEVAGMYDFSTLNIEYSAYQKYLIKHLHITPHLLASAEKWFPCTLHPDKQTAKKLYIFHGTNDKFVPVEQAYLLQKNYHIPDSHVYIDHSGHISEGIASKELIRYLCKEYYDTII